MAASSDRIARKMTYEKERRERISQLFKDLAETLLDAGLPQEAADTQVEALESAIDIIKKWKSQKCDACGRKGQSPATSPGAALPDFSLSSEPDLSVMKTSRSTASSSMSMSTSTSRASSLKASFPSDMARRHSSDVTNTGLASLTLGPRHSPSSTSQSAKTSLKRRRSFETIPQDDDDDDDHEAETPVPPKRKSPPRKGKGKRPEDPILPPNTDRILNDDLNSQEVTQEAPSTLMDLDPRSSMDLVFTPHPNPHPNPNAASPAHSPMIAVYPPPPSMGFNMQSMPAMAMPMAMSMPSMAMSMPSMASASTSYGHGPMLPVTSSTYLPASHSDSFEGSADFVEDLRLIDRMDFYSDSDDL